MPSETWKYQKKYRATEKGAETYKRVRKQYRRSEKGKATRRKWYDANKEKAAAYNRGYKLRLFYDMSVEEWDKLFEGQGKICAICSADNAGWKQGTWHTDHDHKTGKVRGILCSPCNRMLAAAKDNPDCLIEGAKYLWERNGGPSAGD